ncbi:GH39 family glycosyl hydrolase, partial [Phytoactinopolyspora endophytica]|uniref:GH39 family glycosyl hydrolase n=1 Tax=Phytoactinopolyspora endophytica TaxID=1642495 RepID=UPI00197C3CD4
MTTETNARADAGLTGRQPQAAASDPDAPHVRSAVVRVDASSDAGELTPIWASIGYDEINWTYTPSGKRLLRTVGEFSPRPFDVRPHYVFCSGSGFGLPHWGNGNVYHEDEDGTPYYDFTIVDQTYDAIVGAGHHVLVELAFTPKALVPETAYDVFTTIPSPTVYSAYENGLWSFPPKDYGKWAGLVAAHARHCLERYGADEVADWYWELWNEPDIFYWRGTPQQFYDLYAVTAGAVRSVLPAAKVGGPAVTGGDKGPPFLRGFLEQCRRDSLPLDFVSFHTKGSAFTPWRVYGPAGGPAPEQQSPSSAKMLFEIGRLLD